MFRDAITLASRFTFPLILSRRTVGGACASGIGAFVVVNRDGWVITAAHMLEKFADLVAETQSVQSHRASVAAIEANAGMDYKEKKRALKRLGQLPANRTEACSAWWAFDGAQAVDAKGLPAADIAIARLEPFDPKWVSAYPIFKDPARDFRPGTSLCKLGFPFHKVEPIWHNDTQQFELPPGAIPAPAFPLEGMFTQIIALTPEGGTATQFPTLFVQTSTPGLKGHSGGPTFDTRGTIWAIQCKTAHLPLGFDPPVPGGRPGEKEHQFLNVGLGAHPEMIFALFREYGVDFQMSDY